MKRIAKKIENYVHGLGTVRTGRRGERARLVDAVKRELLRSHIWKRIPHKNLYNPVSPMVEGNLLSGNT